MANYTYGNKFRFSIKTEPFLGADLDLNVTSSPVPGLSLGTTEQQTPFKPIPLPGDSLIIDDLTLTILLSENLSEWKYLFKWLSLLKNSAGKNIQNYICDASMNMLSNKDNLLFSIGYENIFPFQLSSIDFTDQITSADALNMTVNFKIMNININDPIDNGIGTSLKIVT